MHLIVVLLVTTMLSACGGTLGATGPVVAPNPPDATTPTVTAPITPTPTPAPTPAPSSVTVSTFAGAPFGYTVIDGSSTTAKFAIPTALTTDGTNLYVIDNLTIHKIVMSTGAVSTIAGAANVSGTVDDIGTRARFTYPHVHH